MTSIVTVPLPNGQRALMVDLDLVPIKINYAASGLVASFTTTYQGYNLIQEFDNDGTVITFGHPWRVA